MNKITRYVGLTLIIIIIVYLAFSSYIVGAYVFENNDKEGAPFLEWKDFSLSKLIVPIILTLSIVLIIMIYDKIIKQDKLLNQSDFHFIDIEVPGSIRTSLQQYLMFFKDYVKIAKQSDIVFDILQTNIGLQIRINKEQTEIEDKINEWFNEYLGLIRKNLDDTIINVEGNPKRENIDILRLKLENQIAHFKNSLKIANFQIQSLSKENEFLKALSIKFANKTNVIQNQYIQGGKQQFADTIKNKDDEN